jgi:hypothetical protein
LASHEIQIDGIAERFTSDFARATCIAVKRQMLVFTVNVSSASMHRVRVVFFSK